MASANGLVNRPPTYEEVMKISNYILSKTKHRPTVGIICGTGCQSLAETLSEQEIISYRDIPNFPVSTVAGHQGRLVFGIMEGKTVVCMQGRCHMYEGYPMWKATLPVRVMKLMGVDTLMASNAAGGLNPEYKEGDIMVMKDHIFIPGLSGDSPLRGVNEERFGPRFPAMNKAYDADLRRLALKIGKELNMMSFLREGVYSMLGGPQFETIAEAKMLSILGADATGMSTAPEVIVAKHCGMRCFGMSLITNCVVIDYENEAEATHEEVLEVGKSRANDMQKFITQLVKEMGPIKINHN